MFSKESNERGEIPTEIGRERNKLVFLMLGEVNAPALAAIENANSHYFGREEFESLNFLWSVSVINVLFTQ